MSSSKLEKARNVFGDVILEDDESGDMSDLSLNYSPSPDVSRHRSNMNQSPTDASFTSLNDGTSPVSLGVSSNLSAASASTVPASASRRNVTSKPFDKIIQSTTHKEKENAASVSSNSSTSAAPKRTQQQRPKIFQRFDKDRVKKTQAAIQQASASVKSAMVNGTGGSSSINPTLNAARKAKEETNRLKYQQTLQDKEEWQQEKQDAQSFHQQSYQQRLRMLRLQQTLSSNQSQTKAQRDQEQRTQQLAQLDHESQFKSAVARDHDRAIKQEQDSRRRMSVAARAKLRQNHKEGANQLERQRMEEDGVLYEERHEASRVHQLAKQNAGINRRQSFAFRNGDARRIRLLHQQMESEKLEQEAASIQLKLASKRDVDEAKRRLEQDRRNSLAQRNAHAKAIRQKDQLRQTQAAQEEHASLELKWLAQKDSDAYQRQLQERNRQSLAHRNEHARMVREQEEKERSKQMAEEHASFELKWAAENDAKVYLNQLEQQDRDDLALANREASRRREFARQQLHDAIANESKSLQLKHEGEKDADAYLQQLESQRRESLAQRSNYAIQQRLEENERRGRQIASEHASYELKWAAEKDVEEYKREMAAKDHESLAWKNKEAFRRARVMKELTALALEKQRESLVIKWAGEEDAKEYLASLEEDRRKSLQQRGKQAQHHRHVESEVHEKELQQQASDEEWNAGAQKDVEEYKRRCAARDRTSLQYRGKEAHVRRIEAVEQQVQEQRYEQFNFELETQARQDVEEYIRECKQRRRMSLALRAKEKRCHFQWRSQRAHQDRAAYSREVRARLADQRSAELARQEERARRALEAIKHSGCSFNPFSSVL